MQMVLKVETVMRERTTNVVKQQKHQIKTGATKLQVIIVSRICQKQELGVILNPILIAMWYPVTVIQTAQVVQYLLLGNKGYINNAPTYIINLKCGVVIRDGYQLPEPSFHLTTHTIRASRLVEHNLSGANWWPRSLSAQAAPA